MTVRNVGKAFSAPSMHDLHVQLLDRYGPVIGGQDLRQVLGFPSAAAFRQAALRRTLPVPVFTLPNRKGRYALASEVSAWLSERRGTATLPFDQSRSARGGGATEPSSDQ